MEFSWRTPPEPVSPERIAQTITADIVILGGGQPNGGTATTAVVRSATSIPRS